jgi:flagellar biosynthesis/type III secretory pathway chaperone
MEELISTLEQENEIYKELIPIADSKTQVIVRNDLERLHEVTALEQEKIEIITKLEKNRIETIRNIGTVLSVNPSTLNLKALIKILEKQPKEQEQLSKIHDNLKVTIQRLADINSHNKSLIEQSLEMIEFNMNFIQSTRMSPGSNNYTRGANTFEAPASQTGMFDAKQ